jgi:hypothetical protein
MVLMSPIATTSPEISPIRSTNEVGTSARPIERVTADTSWSTSVSKVLFRSGTIISISPLPALLVAWAHEYQQVRPTLNQLLGRAGSSNSTPPSPSARSQNDRVGVVPFRCLDQLVHRVPTTDIEGPGDSD